MKILVAAAGATTLLALGGIIATWSVVYSSDISSVDDPELVVSEDVVDVSK